MSTDDQPVCWGRRHSYTVEKMQSGLVVIAEFLDDDAVAFARCVAPTNAEVAEWLNHAWQAGQDYEVRRRDEYDAAEETEAVCPTCTGDCTCPDVVKEARARFAPDGEGAVRRRNSTTTTSSYPRTVPAATVPSVTPPGGGTGVTAPFPGFPGLGAEGSVNGVRESCKDADPAAAPTPDVT